MTDWLKYEWVWQEQSAVFRVDMQYWNLLPVLSYTQLIEVSITSKHAGGKFRATEHYMFNVLRRRLIDKLGGNTIYVGGVTNSEVRNLYFYTNDSKMLVEATELCRGFKKLNAVCSYALEPDYATYYTLLYPDDAKLQSVENAAFLKSLRKKEAEMNLVHRMRLTAAFLNAEDRVSFCENAGIYGLSVGECFSLPEGSHTECCYVYGYAQLKLESLNRLTARLIHAIAPREGMLSKVECDTDSGD